MIEKIRSVSNPLTIIAIFAALAEIAGTVALATVDKSLQSTFVWFVMGFPVLLVLSFFATLNFNPKVLYAPSDFKNEENFLNTLIGTRSVSMNLDSVLEEFEEAKKQILSQAVDQIAAAGQERKKLPEIVSERLNGIEVRLESVRREAEVVASAASGAAYPQSSLQARILQLLASEPLGCTSQQVANRLGMTEVAIARALKRLNARGLIASREIGMSVVYTPSQLAIENIGSDS